jgi:hypothetical protein
LTLCRKRQDKRQYRSADAAGFFDYIDAFDALKNQWKKEFSASGV